MQKTHKLLIGLVLGVLIVSGFSLRLKAFGGNEYRSIDEYVYYSMALQVKESFFDYNSISYGQYLSDMGRPLPKYFFKPLFKHPPVFTYLCAFMMYLFGENIYAAGMVSLLMGVLAIPLVYALGYMCYNWRIGLLASILFWMDPVSIICSQKVWLDTPIAFFTLATAVAFVAGAKYHKSSLLILSGVLSGLGVNTKYSAILITFSIFLYAVVYRVDLFRLPSFQLSLILPFLMLLPWAFWNYMVYGADFFAKQLETHHELKRIFNNYGYTPLIIAVCVGVCLLGLLFLRIKSSQMKNDVEEPEDEVEGESALPMVLASIILVGVFYAVILKPYFLHSLNWESLPAVSWGNRILKGATSEFYFGRLIEFFLVYAFAFLGLFLYQAKENVYGPFLRFTCITLFIFFIAWGNFQSRYILSAIPFLLVIAANTIGSILKFSDRVQLMPLRILLRLFVLFIVAYAIAKTSTINALVSYTNDMCYF